MQPQPHYRTGDNIGNRYLVHRALMGGMGEVYLCLDTKENYPYALKTFQQRYLTDLRDWNLLPMSRQPVGGTGWEPAVSSVSGSMSLGH